MVFIGEGAFSREGQHLLKFTDHHVPSCLEIHDVTISLIGFILEMMTVKL